jgi:hypothetical protein
MYITLRLLFFLDVHCTMDTVIFSAFVTSNGFNLETVLSGHKDIRTRRGSRLFYHRPPAPQPRHYPGAQAIGGQDTPIFPCCTTPSKFTPIKFILCNLTWVTVWIECIFIIR